MLSHVVLVTNYNGIALVDLSVQQNQLNGTIPSELGVLGNLSKQTTDNCQPTARFVVDSLTRRSFWLLLRHGISAEIRLFGNAFSGTLPSQICQGHSIPVFQIDCPGMACTCCTCYQ